MPLYDYKCEKCEAVSEKIRPSTVVGLACDQCSGWAWRQLSVPAAIKMGHHPALSIDEIE